MTRYNGTTINYSGLNPTNWRNASNLSWRGRQLISRTNGSTTTTYEYNSDGLRTKKTVGTSVTKYVWNEEKLIREETPNYNVIFLYDGEELIGFNVLGINYYYGKDSFGVIKYIYNENGTLYCTYTYDAWGNLIDRVFADPTNTIAGYINPIRYKSYYYDSETGFYYLQSRYYDPVVGRFLNADDAAYLGVSGTILGWNLFGYCENNSVTLADYNGYETIDLKNEFRFIDNSYYGGDQDWWGNSTFKVYLFFNRRKADVGCGPVAAANIIAYLKLYKGLSKLTSRTVKTRNGFLGLMNDVFDYVKPHATGLWFLSTFANGVEKYAKSKGVKLKAYWSSSFPSFNNAVKYIKDGLKRDCPVALNVHSNRRAKLTSGYYQEPMENHWVVITGITDEIVHGKRKVTLTVASWGMRFTLDFRDVYDYSSYWGLMYFTW